MPKASEIAKLTVNNQSFEDWESVYVQHRAGEGWPLFRFTATEGELPLAWKELKFKPGDPCTITLGGELAVTGIITQRQVSYSAHEHGVQLSGVGKQWAGVQSSIDSKDNNFDGMTLRQAAEKALAPFGVKVKVIGKIDETKFEVLQSQPGELVWDFLDKASRMRSVVLGSDHVGNILLIGDHTEPIVQQLTEGENILKMQCVFSNEMMARIYALSGQFAVRDEKSMKQTAEMQAKADGMMTEVYRFIETVTEQPVGSEAELQKRATYEALQRDGTQLRAFITVQGWLRDGVNLWHTRDNVLVKSPMCPLNLALKIQTATFTQDNKSGTTTLLECVLPWMLNDQIYKLGVPKGTDQPKAPEPAKSTTSQPAAAFSPLLEADLPL